MGVWGLNAQGQKTGSTTVLQPPLLKSGAPGTIPDSLLSLMNQRGGIENALGYQQTLAQAGPLQAQYAVNAKYDPLREQLGLEEIQNKQGPLAARQGYQNTARDVANQLFGFATGDVNRKAGISQRQLRGSMESSGNYGGGLYGLMKGDIEGQQQSDLGQLGAKHRDELGQLGVTDAELAAQAKQLGIDERTLRLLYQQKGDENAALQAHIGSLFNVEQAQEAYNNAQPVEYLLNQAIQGVLGGGSYSPELAQQLATPTASTTPQKSGGGILGWVKNLFS